MSTYPAAPRADFLQWCQSHAPVFTAGAAAIGLTPAQATEFQTLTADAAAALLAQEEAKQAAKVATQVAQNAFSALMTNAGLTVKTIRAFAEQSATPATVYAAAQIPAPASPSPAPPPAQPTGLTVTLRPQTGALELRWKASNPAGTSGTSYLIRRRLPGETGWTVIGVSGKKFFVDDTLVAGADWVHYIVQGQRAGSSGPLSQVFVVTFGIAPGGATMAHVGASAAASGIPAPAAFGGNGGGYGINGNGHGMMGQRVVRQRVGI